MNTDQTSGAGAYKADSREDAIIKRDERKAPYRLRLTRDRGIDLDYKQVALAAGALGIGYVAFKGVQALLGSRAGKSENDYDARLEPVPLAGSATPEVKDNAAPRFGGQDVSEASGATTSAAAGSATPEVKDNAAPRFAGEGASTAFSAPFVAASDQDDTGELVVQAATTNAAPDRSAQTPEHVPTDLMGDQPPTANDRAIDAFRPDPTAPVPDEMRESLRPATGPAPSMAAARGTFAQGFSQTDGSK